jgi:Holliday junction resolvase RusA-like endonuclease
VAIYDPIPKSYNALRKAAAELGLINPPVGDLDNKVKAITDGLNGVAYIDDKQINCIEATREYGDHHMIFVRVERNGLSLEELREYAEHRASKRRT